MINNLFLFINLLVVFNLYSQDWVKQESTTNSNLLSVYFINVNIGFVSGTNGLILKTTDGGNHWISVDSGTSRNLSSIYFIDSLNGFTVSDIELLKTTDGGKNWFFQDSMGKPDPYAEYSIKFVGNDTGFISGNSLLLKTVNRGTNWTKINTNGGGAKCFWAQNSKILHYGTGCNWIFKSNDGGNYWYITQDFCGGSGNNEDMFFINKDIGFVVGGNFAQGNTNGLIFKTINGGESWQLVNNISKYYLNSICFVGNYLGYVTGENGVILKTIDQGKNWIKLNSNTINALNSIFFTDSLSGYAVGENGTILKTENGGGSVRVNQIKEESDIKLYPNPVKEYLIIELKNEVFGDLSIFDLKGRLLYKQKIVEPTTYIALSFLIQGTYILKYISNQDIRFLRLHKQ